MRVKYVSNTLPVDTDMLDTIHAQHMHAQYSHAHVHSTHMQNARVRHKLGVSTRVSIAGARGKSAFLRRAAALLALPEGEIQAVLQGLPEGDRAPLFEQVRQLAAP